MSFYSKFKVWLNNDTFVQLGHGAGGYGIILTAVLWGLTWKQVGIGWLLVMVWTVPKEYVFDILVEKATFADGWIDQRSYLFGAAIATALVWARL